MIKLRVEWRHRCADCGTCLVVDFLAEAEGSVTCPWCGQVERISSPPDIDLRSFISEAVQKIEDEANGRTPVKS